MGTYSTQRHFAFGSFAFAQSIEEEEQTNYSLV